MQMAVLPPGVTNLGVIVRTIDPDQAEMRIVVPRQRGGVQVEVTVLDRATGKALEPLAAWLTQLDAAGQLVGVSRALSVRDGMVRDDGTPVGRYRLSVHTHEGYRGDRELEIAAGVTKVREQLLIDAPGLARVTLDLEAMAGARPERLRIELLPYDGGELRSTHRIDDGYRRTNAVLLDLAHGSEFEVSGARADRELILRIVDAGVVGEIAFTIAPGETKALTLRATAGGRLAVTAPAPATFDFLLVQWQRGDGSWCAPWQLTGCRDRRELGAVTVPAGSVKWRVGFRADGQEQQLQEGRCDVVAGGTTTLALR